MKFYIELIVVGVISIALNINGANKQLTEKEFKEYFATEYEKTQSFWCTNLNIAEWAYETDINNSTKEQILLNVTLDSADQDKIIWQDYFQDVDPNQYQDPDLRRKIKFAKILGKSALDNDKLSKLTNSINTMTNIYSTAKICPYRNQNCDLQVEGLSLEPDIEDIFAKSRNFPELAYIWKSWRDATGAKMRDIYKTYVDLSNEAAKANDFADTGEEWRFYYESDTFVQDIDALWSQVEPLYLELHKYASRKLKKIYGDDIDISDGLLPANIFGNVWAQDWLNIEDILKPYPKASEVNIDQALLKQNYTVLRMFETANNFYKSLGLLPNDICYDTSKGALIEKPTDGREVLCHASAWDFCDGKNYRIKMCTSVNYEDFVTIHHEMGHIEYYQQYKALPVTYRDGANPGFHEAIGDTIALSVSTPKHLVKIGLLQDYVDTEEASLNALMNEALQKIAFLPFGLLIDKWRWDVFNGSVKQDQWNDHWWQYRAKYQKIKAPIPRNGAVDFDPGAKFHVAGDSQYIAYFVAHIAQFQFYKSLCIAANEYNPDDENSEPLHKCDYYESKAAGDILSAGLSIGSSKHWSKAMVALTGQDTLDASALLEYFDPLYQFLKKQNKKCTKKRNKPKLK